LTRNRSNQHDETQRQALADDDEAVRESAAEVLGESP
jgi:HEAT repeat protein